MRALLYTAFALSGGAGLFYELLWSRYLALFVGHAAYAQTLVIGLFLGGMAVGALLVGRQAERLRQPLLWYAAAELALAALGLAFHPAFRGVTEWAYQTAFPALAGTRWPGAVRWVLAGALIFPQSVVLGTTFPLMAGGMLRRFADPSGRTLGNLYFLNSLGGASGVLVAGFLLIGLLGLPGTLGAAAALNLAAAAAAGIVAWRTAAVEAPRSAEARGPTPAATSAAHAPKPGRRTADPPSGLAGLERLLLAAAALTAVASFGYEIGWIRMLSLVMGSATHSFELMLSAFILGLALGSLAIRRAADRAARPVRLLGWIQWGMGLAALATLPVYVLSFDAMAWLVEVLPGREGGYALFALGRYGIALAVMLPSAFLAGTTLPLITNALLRAGAGERAIGRVYGWNTLGSIVGVALAGLFLLPWLGLEGLLIAAAALDIGIGIVLLLRSRVPAAAAQPAPARGRGGASALAGSVALLAVLAAALGVRFDRAVLTSGVFRRGEVTEERPILYYEDGRTATVGAYVTGADNLIVLASNGKADASLTQRWLRAAAGLELPRAPITQQDESTQTLSALVALAHAPEARDAAVIGHGSGITAHTLLASPGLERLLTVEIEPRMIDGSLVFDPANRRAFDDPRSRFVIDDARSYLSHAAEPLDLIVSEPSNPWVSGTSSLFTVEFYRRIRSYMSGDGVFAQWMHLYESRDDLVLSVLAALARAFGDFRGYLVGQSDLLIVATPAAGLGDPDWSVVELPDIERDLDHIHRFTPDLLAGIEVFRRAELDPLLDSWPRPNSDWDPVLELGAERARFEDAFATGMDALAVRRFDLAAALGGRRLGFASFAPTPVWNLAPMWYRARGAWLRAGGAEGLGLPRAPQPAYANLMTRHRRFLRSLSAAEPPANWRGWIARLLQEEGSLHAGTAGVADSAFYAAVREALDRWSAPPGVRSAVAFVEASARFDFAAIAEAARDLLPRTSGDRLWLPPDVLLDATVVALLELERPDEARRAFDRLLPLTSRPADDVRVRLLKAHLERADSESEGADLSRVEGDR